MKKYVPYIIAVVVVLGGVGAYVLATKKDNKAANSTESSQSGSAASAVPAKKYTDACKVFTKEQIGAALGGTYGDGEEGIASGISTATPGSGDDSDDLKSSECEYDQNNDGTTAGMVAALGFSLVVNTYKDTAKANSFMKDLHDPMTADGKAAMDKPVDVSGVGDQAFFAKVRGAGDSGEKVESLYVREGRQILTFNATRLAGIDHPTVQASLTALAKELK